jgi:multimeric flavodoxin WrbA
MIITIIHSSPRANSASSSIARALAAKFEGAQILDINLQKDNLPYCKGCNLCVKKGMEFCPHSKSVLASKDKILKTDLLIVATPVYVLNMSGQLKIFIDHLSAMLLVHRPEKKMFNKQMVVVTSSIGPVYRNTIKEVTVCFAHLGIPKIYRLSTFLLAESFETLSHKKIAKIDDKCNKIASKVKKVDKRGRYHTPLKSKLTFMLSGKLHSKMGFETDISYWKANGWLNKNRPWKN